MSHAITIPTELHTGMRASVKEALGSFWSSVFADQDLVDGELSARVLSASQLYLDAMEALDLRDHATAPVFHRKHWHPLTIRRSARNTGRGLTVGMAGGPVVGTQAAGVFLAGEVFEVGGNALYSKVNTYPLEGLSGCPLVSVETVLCDSISSPKHLLVQGRDFSVEDGILVVRQEQDPFDVDGYRVVPDGEDRLAVLWACDSLFDREHVADFRGYPLGLDVTSSEVTADLLGSLWDLVVFGVTPHHLNRTLGLLFDIPVVPTETRVEKLTVDGADTVVVTTDAVYRLATSRLAASRILAGAVLPAGTFLTDELTVRNGLSPNEVSDLIETGKLTSLSLPAGSIAGVETAVTLENRWSERESGGWFKLTETDTATSPFWTAVFGRTTEDGRNALFAALAGGGSTVNPLRAFGYTVLANTVLVTTVRPLRDGTAARRVFTYLSHLMPDFADLLVVHAIPVDETVAAATDSAEQILARTEGLSETAAAGADDVRYAFVPVAATEV